MNEDNKNKKLLAIGLICLSLSIVGIIFFNYIKYNNSLNYDEEIVESEYTPTKTPIETVTPTPTPTPSTIPSPSQEVVLSDTVKSYQEQYDNPEIIGRIYIPGTIIDYPIAQRKEDTANYFYLKNDYYGNYDSNGSIYLDYENDIYNGDKNTIIYGHNMSENKMFHSIRYFQNKEFYEAHPYIFVETMTETKVYKNFAWMKTDIDFQYLTVNFRNDDEYAQLQQGIIDRSVHPLEIDLTTEDAILNLSTCDNDTSNDYYRFVLSGVLVNTYPIGEEILELSELGE